MHRGWIEGEMNERVNGCVDCRISRSLHERMGVEEWLGGWVTGGMTKWTVGQMNEWARMRLGNTTGRRGFDPETSGGQL